MITLNFNVNKQTLTRTDSEKVVSNSSNIHQCHFNLSDDWNDKEITATFYKGVDAISVCLDDDNNCLIPTQFLKAFHFVTLKLGVAGISESETITSTLVDIPVSVGATPSDAPAQITYSLFEQLMQKIDEIKKQKGNSSETVTTGVSDFDKFCDNIDIDYEYDSATNANYTIIRVYRDRLDGTKQYPFVYAPNGANACQKATYEIANEDGWFLAINSGIFNTSTHKADGMLIENGVVYQNSPTTTHPECRPLTIDQNGTLAEVSYDADADTLVNNGIVSAVCGFMAIVKDFAAVSSSEWNSVSHYTQNAQRQIIGQFGNGDYAIITCEGRNTDNSDGWTIVEAQNICIKHGLKFAYNLDGGGSTETMIGKKHLNHIYEGTTGRKVPTFIVFNGKSTFSTTQNNDTPQESDTPTESDDTPTETAKTLTSIIASKTVAEYTANTSLSTSDITVTAHYSDNTTANVTSSATINTSDVDMSTAGTYSITVQYTEDGVTKTATIQITVVAEPSTEKAYKWVIGYSVTAINEYLNQTPNKYANRATCLTDTQNNAAVYGTDGNILGYLIPIPSDATKVIVTMPSYTTGIALWNSALKRVVDVGWVAESVNEFTFDANTYAYFSVNAKNSSNTAIDAATDTTDWTIEFS